MATGTVSRIAIPDSTLPLPPPSIPANEPWIIATAARPIMERQQVKEQTHKTPPVPSLRLALHHLASNDAYRHCGLCRHHRQHTAPLNTSEQAPLYTIVVVARRHEAACRRRGPNAQNIQNTPKIYKILATEALRRRIFTCSLCVFSCSSRQTRWPCVVARSYCLAVVVTSAGRRVRELRLCGIAPPQGEEQTHKPPQASQFEASNDDYRHCKLCSRCRQHAAPLNTVSANRPPCIQLPWPRADMEQQEKRPTHKTPAAA